MTDYSKEVHFFGEMDLDLSIGHKKLYKKAFDISEACGYFVENFKNAIVLNGQEGEKFVLSFDENGKIIAVWDKTRGKSVKYDIVNGNIGTLPKYDGYGAGFY